MEFKSIGIIGYGAFGAYVKELAQRFVPAVEIKVHSSRFAPDETTFFTLESACSCDVVVLCCAISEYEEKLSTLLPLIPKTSVIVDVATVKVHTAKLFKQLAAGHLYICTPSDVWSGE
ncbi:MAG: NAD(P)-dependent oxidoreductase [Candidatus Paceibacterota bacterium]